MVQNPGLNAFCDSTCQGLLGTTSGHFGDLPTTATDPRFSTVTEIGSEGVSNYNGLTASFTRRTTNLTVQANYTWSHALDEISNGGILQFGQTTNFSPLNAFDPFNLRVKLWQLRLRYAALLQRELRL